MKEKLLDSLKRRVAPVALAATVMLGAMVGCSTNNTSGTSAVEQNKIHAEELWAQAVADEKEMIKGWYEEEIATPETLRNFFDPKMALALPESYCNLNSDHLPAYTFTRSMIEIPELIASYYEALDKVSLEDLSIESIEDAEKEIDKIREEFGIICDTDVAFSDIPTFESETEEIKSMVYFVEGRVWNTLVANINLGETSDTYTRVEKFEGEEDSYNYPIDGFYIDEVNSSPRLSFDTIWCIPIPKKYIKEWQKNGKPIDVIYVLADDIMEDLTVIFAGDEDFKELCEEFEIKGALEQLELLETE